MCSVTNTAVAIASMNLAHAASAHRAGFAAAVAAAGNGPLAAAAMHTAAGNYTAPPSTFHQRSPFAIQELLGLGSQGTTHHSGTSVAGENSPRGGSAPTDPVISVAAVSSYLPRTLPCVSQASCLGDPTPSPHTFPAWRPNFMHAFPGSTPSQNVLQSLGAAAASAHPGAPGGPHPAMLHPHHNPHTDPSSGKLFQNILSLW